MTDLLYVAIIALFFASSWGVMKVCDMLDDNKTGGQS